MALLVYLFDREEMCGRHSFMQSWKWKINLLQIIETKARIIAVKTRKDLRDYLQQWSHTSSD